MKMERLTELLESTLAPIRDAYGFPATKPVEFSYLVSEDVIASATQEKCKRYLRQKAVFGRLFPNDLESLVTDLRANFPEEAERVIEALKKTQTREHVAAVSLITQEDQPWVRIVNAQEQLLTLEGWKFVALLEEPDKARRLHRFTKRRFDAPEPLFAFNANKLGEVVGKFSPQSSLLEVACLEEARESGNQFTDRASFILDLDYALCLIIVLKRLRHDKERFDRLFEAAQAAEVADPFTKIFPQQS